MSLVSRELASGDVDGVSKCCAVTVVVTALADDADATLSFESILRWMASPPFAVTTTSVPIVRPALSVIPFIVALAPATRRRLEEPFTERRLFEQQRYRKTLTENVTLSVAFEKRLLLCVRVCMFEGAS